MNMYGVKWGAYFTGTQVTQKTSTHKESIDRVSKLVYIMTTMKINIKEARERFSEIVNRASYKGERIVLMSRNKPKALIVGLEEAETFEGDPMRKGKRLLQLEQIGKIRERLAHKKIKSDSAEDLRKLRESRREDLTGSR